ncbi:MAG: DUF1844 domain-containing protein [Elusimicrobia bacterium]|nr:DUF1844 domain-containing protein [Elusimicrobiota bacterium]
MNNEFFALVMMLNNSTMIHLGKVSNPVSGKIEKNLNQAKMTIDILEMVREKTKGNLESDEEKLLNGILADLQLNYVAEVEKEQQSPQTPENENKKDK